MKEPSEACELLLPNEGGLHTDPGKGGRSIGKTHACIKGHNMIVQHSLNCPVLLHSL